VPDFNPGLTRPTYTQSVAWRRCDAQTDPTDRAGFDTLSCGTQGCNTKWIRAILRHDYPWDRGHRVVPSMATTPPTPGSTAGQPLADGGIAALAAEHAALKAQLAANSCSKLDLGLEPIRPARQTVQAGAELTWLFLVIENSRAVPGFEPPSIERRWGGGARSLADAASTAGSSVV
ncbi:MAG: hypothetical protein BJ554DRAFT_1572, partial [Olpidium bornovanus]